MGDRECVVPEERWIDWVEGRLREDTREAMDRHLERCERCQASLREWRELLGSEEVGSGALPGADGKRLALRGVVRRIGWRRRAARLGAGSGWLAAAACALAIVIAVPMLLARPSSDSTLRKPAQAYAKEYAPGAAALMGRPDTVVYARSDEGSAPRYGPEILRPAATVWVNGRTGELFLLLEGLLPSDRLDVQAWGALDDHLMNLGLLEFHRDQGHLYSRVGELPAFREVAFTVEPKGGSESPTSPHSLAVRLER